MAVPTVCRLAPRRSCAPRAIARDACPMPSALAGTGFEDAGVHAITRRWTTPGRLPLVPPTSATPAAMRGGVFSRSNLLRRPARAPTPERGRAADGRARPGAGKVTQGEFSVLEADRRLPRSPQLRPSTPGSRRPLSSAHSAPAAAPESFELQITRAPVPRGSAVPRRWRTAFLFPLRQPGPGESAVPLDLRRFDTTQSRESLVASARWFPGLPRPPAALVRAVGLATYKAAPSATAGANLPSRPDTGRNRESGAGPLLRGARAPGRPGARSTGATNRVRPLGDGLQGAAVDSPHLKPLLTTATVRGVMCCLDARRPLRHGPVTTPRPCPGPPRLSLLPLRSLPCPDRRGPP